MTETKPSMQPTYSVGYAMPLTVLFVALKLTGVIDWSWWWVLAPVWISACIVVGALAVLLALAVKR